MSVARPLLRALLRAESAWRRAARETMERSSASAAATASPFPTSTSSSLDRTSAAPAPPLPLLRFREPMDTSAWQRGRHGLALGGGIYHFQAATTALGSGSLESLFWPPAKGVFRGTELRRLILRNFRSAKDAFEKEAESSLDLSVAEDTGFAALRALGEQRAMERCSSDSVGVNGIRVEATAQLVAALPCSSSSSSRASLLFGSAAGRIRSVSSAGPGVIVITSVEGGSSDDDDSDEEEEESDGEEDSDGDVSGAASRVVRHAAPSSPSSSSSSAAPEMRYVFTYRLRITNTNPPLPGGEESESADDNENDSDEEEEEQKEEPKGTPGLRVQLLSRGWQIRDSSGRLHASVPKGSPGVVGCTPVLDPGETFEYYSSTDLPTPAGVMSGSFGMSVVGISGSESSDREEESEEEDESSNAGSKKRKKQKKKRKAPSPPPLLPSTVALRRFEAIVAPFPLRADPLKR